jgi:choline dehydrogenase
MTRSSEITQLLLDQAASGRLSRRLFLVSLSAAGLSAGLSEVMMEQALAAGENQAANKAQLKGAYDYIIVGGGGSGSIIAGELSKTGVDVLLVESGGADTGPTISNPSIWFYNVGGPLDWKLPIAPVAQLNNRKFNMALGHVLGGGSSINAMVWTRGMERDYDAWERGGAKGWGLRTYWRLIKLRRIGKAAKTNGAALAARSTFASPAIRIPSRLPSSRPRGRWVSPLSTM